MIDLHLHLDGSIQPETISHMAELSQLDLSISAEDAKEQMQVAPDCTSLKNYLEKFKLPLMLLQTAECLEYAVYELMRSLQQQGLCYAEIRFAPQLHTQKGLSQDMAVQAAISGLKRGISDFALSANLILCCMRSDENLAENMETVKIAEKYLGKGICAVDLAGDEAAHPTEAFREVFLLAGEKNIPIIIHAGEAAGADSIRQALQLGAVRIGHGIHAIEDAELMELLKEKNIFLEMCYTSNLQTKAANDLECYPLNAFLENGLPITINTDNMTVSNTTLKKEYQLLQKQFSLDPDTLQNLALSSAEAAFVSEQERERLKNRIRNEFSAWLS